MRIIRHALLNSDKLFGIEIKFYERFDKNLGVSGDFVTKPIWHSSSLYAWSGLVLHSCYQSQCAVFAEQHEFSVQKAARKSLIDYRRTAGRAQKLHKFNLSSRMWEWIDSVPLQGLASAFKCQKIGIFRLQSRTMATNHGLENNKKHHRDKSHKGYEKGSRTDFLEFNSFAPLQSFAARKLNECRDHLARWFVCFRRRIHCLPRLHRLLPRLLGITRPKLCFSDEVSTPLALYSVREVHS